MKQWRKVIKVMKIYDDDDDLKFFLDGNKNYQRKV